jgi:plastocyanin
MKTIGVTLTLVLAGLAAAVAVARPATSAGSLTGSVGPGYSISLLQNGTKVTSLAPGDYTITVDDKSDQHDFHLLGPGVDQATTVEGTGSTTWNVTFQNGTYTYQCDVHGALMTGKFTVGAVSTTTTTATTTPTAPPPAVLKVRATAKSAAGHVASVHLTANRSASFAVSLLRGKTVVARAKANGKVVTVRLKARKAGRYVAKVVAHAGTSTAKASAAVTVK